MDDAAQRLFALYADEAKKPHAGGQYKDFVRTLLARATEAGLWREPKMPIIAPGLSLTARFDVIREMVDGGYIDAAQAAELLRPIDPEPAPKQTKETPHE